MRAPSLLTIVLASQAVLGCSSAPASAVGADASPDRRAAPLEARAPDGQVTCGEMSSTSTCGACMYSQCCGESTNCQADPACSGLLACVTLCGDDSTCEAACEAKFPDGMSDYGAYTNCKNTACFRPCVMPVIDASASACGIPGFNASCSGCIISHCCDEATLCDNEEACRNLIMCGIGCSGTDASDTCDKLCEDGLSVTTKTNFINILNCITDSCPACS